MQILLLLLIWSYELKVRQLTGAKTRMNCERTIPVAPTMRRVKVKLIKALIKEAFSGPLFLSSANQSLSSLEQSTKRISPFRDCQKFLQLFSDLRALAKRCAYRDYLSTNQEG